MKILVLNYEYPPIGGGAAPVSKDLAKELVKKGHTVTVFTMKYGELPQHSIEEGVEVFRLPCFRKNKSSCSPLEQFSYLVAVRKFMASHEEIQNYDVCHVHFVIPTAEVARYIKRKYKIPYVITAHGSDVEGHNRKKQMLLMHRVLRRSWRKIVSDSYCTISPSMYLMERMMTNFPAGQYKFIPNGIDYELFCELNEFSGKEKRILVMGRIQKFKNVQFIIKAFSNIEMYEDWKMDIVGDGPYKKEIEKLICECRLENRINMIGWLDNKSEKLLEHLCKASIYVSASQFENCPMSVIESTVAGCYPLVSDIPAHRQILSEEHLFSLSDEKDLISKLEKRMALGETNYISDMKKFDWKNIVVQYEEIMREAMQT